MIAYTMQQDRTITFLYEINKRLHITYLLFPSQQAGEKKAGESGGRRSKKQAKTFIFGKKKGEA
jgi:hypothetical protein